MSNEIYILTVDDDWGMRRDRQCSTYFFKRELSYK